MIFLSIFILFFCCLPFELKSCTDEVVAEADSVLFPFLAFSLQFEQIRFFFFNLIILYLDDIWEKLKLVFDTGNQRIKM